MNPQETTSPETEARPTRGIWEFSSLTLDEFEEVALRAVRIFARYSVIEETPVSEEYITEKYIENTPDLHGQRNTFEMPEADNNEIHISFPMRKITFYPHFGRGSARHDG